MKIALLRQRPASLGGAETTLVYLVRGLLAAGCEVAVYGIEPEAAVLEVLGPGCRYVRVPVWGGKTCRLLAYAMNSRRLLAEAEPQVVFSLERTPGAQVYRAGDGCHREWLQRRAAGLAFPARALQGFSLFHRVMLALETRLFAHPRLKRVIANSRQVQAEIIRHYAVDPARIRVVYNGLDRARFHSLAPDAREAVSRRLRVPAGAELILFVGSGFKRKGLTYLIEAFGSLSHKRYLLWVVGKGNAAPYLSLARRLGVADRIKFWGPMREIAPFYQAAAVLAMPTIYDPCSNAVLEALGCGTPVITTAADGAGEFITAGQNGGVLARPQDASALAKELAIWAVRGRDPEVRRAAQEAVGRLSWPATVARTIEILEKAGGAPAGGIDG